MAKVSIVLVYITFVGTFNIYKNNAFYTSKGQIQLILNYLWAMISVFVCCLLLTSFSGSFECYWSWWEIRNYYRCNFSGRINIQFAILYKSSLYYFTWPVIVWTFMERVLLSYCWSDFRPFDIMVIIILVVVLERSNGNARRHIIHTLSGLLIETSVIAFFLFTKTIFSSSCWESNTIMLFH